MDEISKMRTKNNLTHRDMASLHLLRYVNCTDTMNMPYACTQDGIGDAIGISRAHASLVLLENTHVFSCVMAHVGGKVRRKTYTLTQKGIEYANRLKIELKENGYNVDDILIMPRKPEFSNTNLDIAIKEVQKALYYLEHGEYDNAEYSLATAIKKTIRLRTE